MAEARAYRIRLHGDTEASLIRGEALDIRRCDNGDIEVIDTDGSMIAAFASGTWKWCAVEEFSSVPGLQVLAEL